MTIILESISSKSTSFKTNMFIKFLNLALYIVFCKIELVKRFANIKLTLMICLQIRQFTFLFYHEY